MTLASKNLGMSRVIPRSASDYEVSLLNPNAIGLGSHADGVAVKHLIHDRMR